MVSFFILWAKFGYLFAAVIFLYLPVVFVLFFIIELIARWFAGGDAGCEFTCAVLTLAEIPAAEQPTAEADGLKAAACPVWPRGTFVLLHAHLTCTNVNVWNQLFYTSNHWIWISSLTKHAKLQLKLSLTVLGCYNEENLSLSAFSFTFGWCASADAQNLIFQFSHTWTCVDFCTEKFGWRALETPE